MPASFSCLIPAGEPCTTKIIGVGRCEECRIGARINRRIKKYSY